MRMHAVDRFVCPRVFPQPARLSFRFWTDPRREVCGVVLMQLLPFADKEAIGLPGDFERAVHAAL